VHSLDRALDGFWPRRVGFVEESVKRGINVIQWKCGDDVPHIRWAELKCNSGIQESQQQNAALTDRVGPTGRV
jgi:hypothetical protein